MSQYHEEDLEHSTAGAAEPSRSGTAFEGDRQQKSVRQKVDDDEEDQPEAEDEEEIAAGRGQAYGMTPDEGPPAAGAATEKVASGKAGKKKSRKAGRGAASALEYDVQYDEGSYDARGEDPRGAGGYGQSQEYAGRDDHGEEDEAAYPDAVGDVNRAGRGAEDPMERRKRQRAKKRAARRQEAAEDGDYPSNLAQDNP